MPIFGGTVALGGSSSPLTDRGTWTTGAVYAVNDRVDQASTAYVCAAGHTSGTFSTDLAAGRWVKIDAGTAVPLAQTGQTPSQVPVAIGTAGSVGTAGAAARADHVHPAPGLFGVFGSARYGDAAFDGVNTVSGTTRSGTTYTAGQDLHYGDAVLASGVTLVMNGFRLFVRGQLIVPSGTATVTVSPGVASGTNNATAGFPLSNGQRFTTLGFGAQGGNGGTGAGTAGGAWASGVSKGCPIIGASSGAGGTGSSGAGGVGQGANVNNATLAASCLGNPSNAFYGTFMTADSQAAATAASYLFGLIQGGQAGGGGGGDGTNAGGAGGAGGGVLIVNARAVVGTVNFTAPGGNGGTPTTGNCGGGGAGSGGVVLLNSTDLSLWTGTATAAAGTPGSGVGTGTSGGTATAGLVQTTTWV